MALVGRTFRVGYSEKFLINFVPSYDSGMLVYRGASLKFSKEKNEKGTLCSSQE